MSLDAIRERYQKALDAKPSKGDYTPAGIDAITDSVCDIPILLAEVDRLTSAVHMYADKLAEHECEAAAVAELGVALEETSNNAADYFDRALAAEQAVERVRDLAAHWEWFGSLWSTAARRILSALDGGAS